MNKAAGHNRKKKKQHLFGKIILASLAAVCWIVYCRLPKKKRADLLHMVSDRLQRATQSIVDFLFPHERNGYQPKIFQSRSVKQILLVIVIVKVALVSTLFIVFPNLGSLEQDIRSQMYGLINEYRTSSGVQMLSINSDLELAADAKADDMIAKNYFSHYGPDGKKPWQWLNPLVYDFKVMGENLAMDFLTAGSVFKAFQKSPTHDKNLVNSAYNEIGIAVVNGFLDGHDTNVMVVFFGTRKESEAVASEQKVAAAGTSEETDKPTMLAEPGENQAVAEKVEPSVREVPVSAGSTDSPVPGTSTGAPDEVSAMSESDSQTIAAETPVDIEVLGEAVATDGGTVSEQFETGVVLGKGSKMQSVVAWFDRFFMAFLVTAIVLLVINIVVKIRIQHTHIIANAVILIIVLAGALYLQVHEVEAIGEQIKILGLLLVS